MENYAIRLYESYGFQKIPENSPASPRCNIVMKRNL